jgi:phage tail-like protein
MAVTVKQSIAHLASDPLRNFRFVVDINNKHFSTQMGFMSVSGLNITTEVIPYREGGMNTTTQKMPGQSDFAPITLSKGLAVGDKQMMDWMRKLFTVMMGTGTGAPGEEFRCTMDIKVLDHPVTDRLALPVKACFRVYNAWPTAVAFSDLDAGANAIIVQQMTLAHEGFDVKVADKIGTTSVAF